MRAPLLPDCLPARAGGGPVNWKIKLTRGWSGPQPAGRGHGPVGSAVFSDRRGNQRFPERPHRRAAQGWPGRSACPKPPAWLDPRAGCARGPQLIFLFRTCPACRLLAAGLADAKPNAPANAKVGEASVVKSVCERDRDPNGPRRGAARDHDAALGAGSERQGPGREASGSGERSGSGRRPVQPARA